MKVAVISDVHGNLPNLEKAISFVKKLGDIEKFIFLGDVVGYGPWSNECVQLIDNLKNSEKILGNHEDYFLKSKCNSSTKLVQLFFKYSFKNFNQFDRIRKYRKKIIIKNIKFVHTIKDRYIFEDTKIKIKQNIILGHSHRQFRKQVGEFWILNPGSLGQNRKKINCMNFATVNLDNHNYQFYAIKSDIKLLLNEMKSKKYPNDCIQYYKKRIL